MDPLKKIYQDIKTKIESEIPEIKNTLINNNQIENLLDDTNQELPLLLPAVFIHFENITYNDLQEGVQEAEGECIITIAEWNMIQETSIFDLKTAIYKEIQKLKDTDDLYTSFSRAAETMNTNYEKINSFEMRFRFKFIDRSAETFRTKLSSQPELKIYL